jgi:hypothetical protein
MPIFTVISAPLTVLPSPAHLRRSLDRNAVYYPATENPTFDKGRWPFKRSAVNGEDFFKPWLWLPNANLA